MVLEVYGSACLAPAQDAGKLPEDVPRSESTSWLPDEDSNLEPTG